MKIFSLIVIGIFFFFGILACQNANSKKKTVASKLTDEQLMDTVQKQTFKYFWDFADSASGMAKERNTEIMITSGGSGFGIMAIVVGVERGYITREAALERMLKIVNFLEKAERFHGAWPHWLFGETGKPKHFSQYDDGGDLVETAYLVQGLLTAKEYFNQENEAENELRKKITYLWETVEWDWYRQNDQNVLYWHWSKNYGWKMNMPIRGWNECLITYVLAASSPTHPVPAEVYHEGWTNSNHFYNGNEYEGIKLPLGFPYGGPLFFTHYSFLGLNPNGLKDQYADYFELNSNQSLINFKYCVKNPKGFPGYSDSCWGLTASDDPYHFYLAHEPGSDRDNGTISPTAAISSIVYTPKESMQAMRYFFEELGDSLWGEYGFYDAFNLDANWTADTYLAIDQGPIVVMIENYRTGLLWNNFMKNKDVQNGLTKLGFTYKTTD
ncbi:MAG TPA: glucoamylase family protein [Bacteroidales bacterium]